MLPVIVLTAGEPAGIGPDLCVQIAQQNLPCRLIVAADRELLRRRAQLLGLPLQITDYSTTAPPPGIGTAQQTPRLQVMHIPLAASAIPGKTDPANARYVLQTIRQAVDGCTSHAFDAMVTAPVHKGVINEAGIPFTGHTEYLSLLTSSSTVMMLVGGGMRVALATTHLPLKEVAAAITRNMLEQTLHIVRRDLIARFGIADPRIAVAGLNPHAGESGYLGREEVDIIIPLLNALRDEGMNLIGPLPADTLFNPAYLTNYDCILAMYHDQGLPVLKHVSFGAGVNVTLGLPIIRTSVDHGTALDLASTGRADAGSLAAAIELASSLIRGSSKKRFEFV